MSLHPYPQGAPTGWSTFILPGKVPRRPDEQQRPSAPHSAHSATPATQNEGGCEILQLKRRWMSPCATPATRLTASQTTHGDQARHSAFALFQTTNQNKRLTKNPGKINAKRKRNSKISDMNQCSTIHSDNRKPSFLPQWWMNATQRKSGRKSPSLKFQTKCKRK